MPLPLWQQQAKPVRLCWALGPVDEEPGPSGRCVGVQPDAILLRFGAACHRPGCGTGVVSAAHPARCTARHGVSSNADAVALVALCSIPVT